MPRRSLFLLAAAVVMLYFVIILFMLNPLGGARGGYRQGHMDPFAYRQLPVVEWCRGLHWRSPPGPVVALASYPGSGNTWLRYLLQQTTGLVTGSVYMDHGLRVHGFPAENVTDGSVLVVKTHEAPPLDTKKFKSAILLIRNPKDALLADFNRQHKGHIGTAPKSAFKKKAPYRNKTVWEMYVSTELVAWESLNRLWLSRWGGALHVVTYEALVRDTRQALRPILGFLNQYISEGDMNCAISQKEGIYRRKKKPQRFDPFTDDMTRALRAAHQRLAAALAMHVAKANTTVDWPVSW